MSSIGYWVGTAFFVSLILLALTYLWASIRRKNWIGVAMAVLGIAIWTVATLAMLSAGSG